MTKENISRKCGIASFILFLVMLFGTAFIFAGGGFILFIFAAFGMVYLAPLGLILGLLGSPHKNGKALAGLLGNLLLLLLALWVQKHI